jgi:spore germination protein YaaH
MKKQPAPVAIVLILVAVVAAAGVIAWFVQSRTPSKQHMDLNAYFGITSDDQAAVTADSEMSGTAGKIIDGTVYFPYDTVVSLINKRFYQDTDEQLIDVTTPTELVTESYADGTGSGDVRMIDGTLYLSLPFITKYTDMESTSYTDPQRVVITTKFPYEEATLTEDAAVRYKDSIRSDILEDGTKGETVRIVSSSADEENGITVNEGWTHVVTQSGLIGYLETKSLSEVSEGGSDHVSTIGEYTNVRKDYPVNMAFFQADNADMNAYLKDQLSQTTGITTLAPTWFFLNGTGDVTSIADADFVSTAHAQGIEVWAVINDFSGSISSKAETYAVLKSTSSRTAIISKIMAETDSKGIDGLNIDLENISEEGAPAYLEFIRELAVECRKRNIAVSTDTLVPMEYSSYLDREEQGAVTDYVVVMCYDEHYKGSKEAGSVASLSYVKDGIDKMKKEVAPEKLIAGIPFYTRLWQTIDSGEPASKIMDMTEAAAYVSEHHMNESWDEKTSQNYAELNDDDGYWQIWLEDKDSIAAKMETIQAAGIAGVAEWRLGNETSDVWPVIEKYLS